MNDDVEFTDDLKQLVEENEHIFELKDEILEMCEGFVVDEIEKAFMMAFSDVYINLCSSREECIDRMSVVAAKIMTAIDMFDKTGQCAWNTKQ